MNWIMRTLDREIKKHRTNNPFEIAKNRNIIIRYFPLGQTLGFYMKNVRHQVITINSDIEDYLKKFVCAHELGHAILHKDENTPFLHKNTLFSKDKIEREANEFAVHLLLHGENLEDYETKFDVLRENGIPLEMEKYINFF
ncbi:ImmA/IrrE family metallo-endopeptidase [Aeribacillus composti]|uniref:Putative Zn peptidase n=1 Tax=Anoxybacillus phage A403 TaxID=2099336 RepID=A0A2P1JU12_9CAUD|nr:metallo-protease [Anoxybacillus phage A403]AVO22620.1 putative Zn peptidase [Anoxybacillus phage A403]